MYRTLAHLALAQMALAIPQQTLNDTHAQGARRSPGFDRWAKHRRYARGHSPRIHLRTSDRELIKEKIRKQVSLTNYEQGRYLLARRSAAGVDPRRFIGIRGMR